MNEQVDNTNELRLSSFLGGMALLTGVYFLFLTLALLN